MAYGKGEALAAIARPMPDAEPIVLDSEVRVAFTADHTLVSRGIGYFGGGFWAHMTNLIDDLTVIDARSGKTQLADGTVIPAGVQRRPISYLAQDAYYLEIALPCTLAQRKDWLADLTEQIDQPYDFAGIFDFVDGNTVDPNWRGHHHPWFCDELGLWALRKNKIIRPQLTPFYRNTPGTAAEVCLATAGSRITAYRGDIVANQIKAAGLNLAEIHGY